MEEKDRLKSYKDKYKNNYNKYIIQLQLEKSRIKKFRNEIETNTRLVGLYGAALLFFNIYLAISFCGV